MVLPTGVAAAIASQNGATLPAVCGVPAHESHGHLSGFPSFLLTIHVVPITTDGRRPVYLTVLPIFTLGSLGVALARTVPQLMLFRVVQAFGGGGGMSVGAGVISDIYRLEERGSAMGFFFAVSLF